MQTTSLTRAKIQAPLFRSGLIERGELERQLCHALAHCRLVLLVAPAGYGKTAALSRQLQCAPAGCAAAWLTADAEDDLQRFFLHLIEALEPLDPPWRLAAEALVELGARGSLREAAAELAGTLEAIASPGGGMIVLDDLHTVADARVFEWLGELIEALPQGWTLVIGTRVEPPLALGRWRARREVAEFDETILGFSRTEVQDLWRHATGRDDPEQTQRLLDRTQGWPAGLCLSLEASARSGVAAPRDVWHNRRHLFDYLASEVFEDLPEELQAFLLRCSLLPELTVPRCEQISGNPRAARLLEDIERRRLFTSVLDSNELTLRLHDLFRDFLEERLRRLHPEEVPALLRRAAQGEPVASRRTLLYLRAGAWDEAQQCLLEATADMLAADEGAQALRLVEQFPAGIQASSPVLAYVRGWCAWPHYRYGAVHPAMAQAAAGFDALGRPGDAQRARAMQALALLFCGRIEEGRALSQAVRAGRMDLETEALSETLDFWYACYHGPAEGPGVHLAKAVDLLLERGSAELWLRCMPRVNTFISRPGVSTQMQRLVQGARTMGDGHGSLQANANLMEAWLLLWQGRIAEMGAAFQQIEDDARWLGHPTGLRIRLLTLKAYHQVICDDEEIVRTTRDATVAHVSMLDRPSQLRLFCLTNAVMASAAIGDWPAVRQHLPEFEAEGGHENPFVHNLTRCLEGQLALHEGRVGEALAMLRALAPRTALLDAVFLDTTVRTRLALAELADGSPAAAWRALEPLVERVTATGSIGQVLFSGVHVLTELSRAPWGDAAPEVGLASLRQWAEAARQARSVSRERPPASAANDSDLSDRELEVLALLASGQSNKLIARALDLSPHTVKRHVARILDRLDLASRMQAADWYRTHFSS